MILKLKEAGEHTTLTITKCEAVRGNFGDQVAFSAGEDVLFVGKDTADRQLERCGFAVGDYQAVVGSTLRFSREANTKKPGAAPFWNIEVSSAGEAKQSATPSRRVPPPKNPAPPVVNAFDAMVPEDDYDFPPEPPELQALRPSASKMLHVPATDDRDDVQKYTDLMGRIAVALDCPVTEPNVQGAAATLWIQWHRNR